MNIIKKTPLGSLGYDFIKPEYLPKGKDEYYLRNLQNRSGINYRRLTTQETEVLVRNNNTAEDWEKVLVSDAFNPELVRNCKFFGLIRIGKLEPVYLEFHDVRHTVGLYNSTIISCDFGDNVIVSNVNYMSHYILGNEVIVVNVNELVTTDHAKFGNGVIKDGESERTRIWLEVCNENGGRSIIPFNNMLPGDAYLWARYRDDVKLLDKFKQFTQNQNDHHRGYYGKIGDRTIIKNTRILKDVWIGTDAYIKGANKLKNLTINSSAEAKSQVGEGCELVNGIVGVGCRVFYGVKAVRFILASNSQLKYGARLINSYLGNNATISCCEVLNSLIFPAHEQHHNNSFLCAALIMGQTNMAAGATIGSNHNSRSADGEIIAARGFWPGLCVSLKHNSKFASFTLVAKGDFPAELNIPLPFSLVSNDVANDQLVVMPAYWPMYNMYALARNADKYVDRDKRIEKTQNIEYAYLAPDSINEIFSSLQLLEQFTGQSYAAQQNKKISEAAAIESGKELLQQKNETIDRLKIFATGFENSNRRIALQKVPKAYHTYRDMITWYGMNELLKFIKQKNIKTWETLRKHLPLKAKRTAWLNVGGQLIQEKNVETLKTQIKNGRIKSWEQVHSFYEKDGSTYAQQKFEHAFASLLEIHNLKPADFNKKIFSWLLQEFLRIQQWMLQGIIDSRSKDYQNAFRKMVYDNQKQMNLVLGKLSDNTFIEKQQNETAALKKQVTILKKQFKIS